MSPVLQAEAACSQVTWWKLSALSHLLHRACVWIWWTQLCLKGTLKHLNELLKVLCWKFEVLSDVNRTFSCIGHSVHYFNWFCIDLLADTLITKMMLTVCEHSYDLLFSNIRCLKSVHCYTILYICFTIWAWVSSWCIYSRLWFLWKTLLADTMHSALRGKVWHPPSTFRAEQCKESLSGEQTRQRVMIYGFSQTNWWLVVTESLVFIDLCFVFWITIPDLLCKQRLESAFRSRSQVLH